MQKPTGRNAPDPHEGVAEDRRLVLLARGGERAAFEALVVKYAGVVRSLTAARLGRGPDAEDAAQDAFLRAYQQLPRLEDPERFAGWLSTIAVNCALERLRRGERRRAASLDALEAEPPAAQAAVGSSLERAEDAARLLALVGTLDDRSQIVLALRFREGMAVRDIAARLGENPPAVAMRISRALRRLRDALGEATA